MRHILCCIALDFVGQVPSGASLAIASRPGCPVLSAFQREPARCIGGWVKPCRKHLWRDFDRQGLTDGFVCFARRCAVFGRAGMSGLSGASVCGIPVSRNGSAHHRE
jgi:hypothetical protein